MEDLNEKLVTCPKFGYVDLLEDAFKTPVYDQEGHSEPLPVIWDNYSYGETAEVLLTISSKSAKTTSTLYSKYLDEEALIGDANLQRLLLYLPDTESPKVAFKGSGWTCAKRLKDKKEIVGLEDVYMAFKF